MLNLASPLSGLGAPFARRDLARSIRNALFGAGEAGGFYAPSPATAFADTAGTTPAAAGDPVAQLLDLSGNDNHATQETLAARPIFGRVPASGRRNILTQSENAGSFTWAPEGVTIVEETGSVDAPTAGPVRVWSITETDTNTPHRVRATGQTITEGVTYTASIYAKAGSIGSLFVTFFAGGSGGWSGGATFNLTNGTVSAANATIVDMGNGWYRCSLTTTATGGNANGQAIWGLKGGGTYQGNPNHNIYLTGRVLEIASEPSRYQRTGTEFDITEVGQAERFYVFDDGVDDSLLATLPDLGTDATLAYASDEGVTILTGQTIGAGAFDVLRDKQLYGLIVNNRAWTASETERVTRYLERLSVSL